MESLIRLSVAAAVFLMMISWEALKPRRPQQVNRKQRWPVNLGLALFNMGLMRITIGGLAYLSAVWAGEKGYGLINYLSLNNVVGIVLTLLALDLSIYAQHIVMHKVPWLWRLHKVHHTDLAFDATTAVRFHPLEIVLSMLYKVFWIILIGAHPGAVIAFEIILNAAATFNHSNIDIPESIDKKLRWLLITPDMHRIHHSTIPSETDSNYGFSISCWDRFFKTYTAQPQQAQTSMLIGLDAYRQQDELGFLQLFLLPFKPLKKK